MMIPRTIGYHEKNEKQRTAPMRKAQAEAFRRTRGSMCGAGAGRSVLVKIFSRGGGAVATFAIPSPGGCQGWRAPGAGGCPRPAEPAGLRAAVGQDGIHVGGCRL